MYLYRLCRDPFSALDGEGARLYGGRWNSPGAPVIYTPTSLALAALEYLVHLDPTDAPSDLVALTIEVPDTLAVETVDVRRLGREWAKRTSCPTCQGIGDKWLSEATTALLRVPAAPVPEEYNILINPRHPDASNASIIAKRPFEYDPRLLG
ncbi:MAG: RES family NAD+ phosphorylase [Gemmatimonadaceae bacterium]|nr:RES family NAD+ phosphorylase [Gemmatimonadaceae bacterium]